MGILIQNCKMLGSKIATTLAGTKSIRNSSGKLKELNIRIKSVTNIQKITKTMNMISAAKYAKAAKNLGAVREFREAKGADGKYIVVGEKARIALRSMGELSHVLTSVADVGRVLPTFADCAEIAQEAMKHDWESGVVL